MENLEIATCSKCKSSLAEQDKFCSECGFPERGTDKEKDLYDYRIKLKMDVIEEAQIKLKNVKLLLYFVAGINFLMGVFYIAVQENYADGIFNIVAAVIFLACIFWVNKQPLTGILAAFIFWIVLQLSVILIDPALLVQGIILKVVFIGVFIKGISSAYDVKKYSAQLKEFKAI